MGVHVRGKLRLSTSRSRRSPVLAVIGGCLGVYVFCAMVFHWFVEPTVAKNRGPALDPVPARIVQDSRPASRAEPSAATAAKSAAAASGSESKKSDRLDPSRVASKPPTSATATAESKKTARAEAPSRGAAKP